MTPLRGALRAHLRVTAVGSGGPSAPHIVAARIRFCAYRPLRAAKPNGTVRKNQQHGGGMRRSDKRILTTHTGSLPRPLELTRLYAQRARGETVDAGVLATAGRDAMKAIIAKQVE